MKTGKMVNTVARQKTKKGKMAEIEGSPICKSKVVISLKTLAIWEKAIGSMILTKTASNGELRAEN